uniref:DUF928 domain-containing protein n=1 Tax=Oscillatoriales cyanobacterium SpSt-402 TaxID=2282168 RepID=A0A832H4C6_9CYAN
MIKKSYLYQFFLTIMTFTVCSESYSAFLARSPYNAYASQAASIRFNRVNMQIPANIGEPKGRGAGGRRGCNANDADDQLIPLVPITETSDRSIRWGLTTSAHPTLWVYSPKGFQNGALIWLSVLDQTNTMLYRIPFQIPKTSSGVLQFAVPSKVASLQPNTPYRWQLTIYCNSGGDNLNNLTFDTPFIITGGVQRIVLSADSQQQLAIAKTSLGKAIVYAKNGIWYDSLTTLGNSIRDSTAPNNDMLRAWMELLQQSNLEKPASSTLVKCCTPKEN